MPANFFDLQLRVFKQAASLFHQPEMNTIFGSMLEVLLANFAKIAGGDIQLLSIEAGRMLLLVMQFY
jgi:hypothetical protein